MTIFSLRQRAKRDAVNRDRKVRNRGGKANAAGESPRLKLSEYLVEPLGETRVKLNCFLRVKVISDVLERGGMRRGIMRRLGHQPPQSMVRSNPPTDAARAHTTWHVLRRWAHAPRRGRPDSIGAP
eukprot:818939-Rhodomonas_salina.2